MSKKLLGFKTDPAHYEADATIVWCFDDRFSKALSQFVNHEGFNHHDALKIAGGAKSLISPANELDRQFLVRQIKISIKLHKPKRIVLMIHSDCNAYGGLTAFNDDPHAELEYQSEQLRRAAKILEMNIPPIKIQKIFVDFNGIHEIE